MISWYNVIETCRVYEMMFRNVIFQLVKGLGRSFPFQGRGFVLDQLWDAHKKRFDLRTVGDRRSHPIATFMGQSGVGK